MNPAACHCHAFPVFGWGVLTGAGGLIAISGLTLLWLLWRAERLATRGGR